jgi:hypothetical protein
MHIRSRSAGGLPARDCLVARMAAICAHPLRSAYHWGMLAVGKIEHVNEEETLCILHQTVGFPSMPFSSFPKAFPRSPLQTVTLGLSRPCKLPIHHDRSPGEGKKISG